MRNTDPRGIQGSPIECAAGPSSTVFSRAAARHPSAIHGGTLKRRRKWEGSWDSQTGGSQCDLAMSPQSFITSRKPDNWRGDEGRGGRSFQRREEGGYPRQPFATLRTFGILGEGGGVPDGGDWTEVRVLRAAHLLVRLGRWGDAFGGTAVAPSPGGHPGNSGNWTRNEDGIGDGKSKNVLRGDPGGVFYGP